MTVVSFTAIHPKPGAKWEETKKHLKKGCDLARSMALRTSQRVGQHGGGIRQRNGDLALQQYGLGALQEVPGRLHG